MDLLRRGDAQTFPGHAGDALHQNGRHGADVRPVAVHCELAVRDPRVVGKLPPLEHLFAVRARHAGERRICGELTQTSSRALRVDEPCNVPLRRLQRGWRGLCTRCAGEHRDGDQERIAAQREHDGLRGGAVMARESATGSNAALRQPTVVVTRPT